MLYLEYLFAGKQRKQSFDTTPPLEEGTLKKYRDRTARIASILLNLHVLETKAVSVNHLMITSIAEQVIYNTYSTTALSVIDYILTQTIEFQILKQGLLSVLNIYNLNGESGSISYYTIFGGGICLYN